MESLLWYDNRISITYVIITSFATVIQLHLPVIESSLISIGS